MRSNAAKFDVLYIGTQDYISNNELVVKIINVMNASKDLIEYVNDRPGHDRKYALDCSKIKEELGWKPKYNFDETIEKVVEWYVAESIR